MVIAAEVDHVTVIVEDVEATRRALAALLGTEPTHEVSLPGMAIRTFRIGDVELHVNAPTGAGPVRDFLERSGGPAYHHLALRVADLDAALASARAAGFVALGDPVETAPGLREVFLDPRTTGGVMIQLVARTAKADAALDGGAIAHLASQLSQKDTV
ncbi:MAG: VOC family protein [Polyangiaceae bacterium]